MHFGENQLSQSLIGLSPLSTAHPLHFQLKWVRSSTTSYRRFNLAMDRSLRFGSRSCHSNALFRLAFATDTPHGLTSRHNTNSQAHSSKGTLSPQKAPTACKHTVSGTISLPSRGTFHHSLTVLCTIGHQVVFRLTKWSWQIHTRFHESRATRVPRSHHTTPVHLHDSHALRSDFPDCSTPSIMRCDPPAEESNMAPQHQTRNGRRLSHASGLASSAFARHYSRNIFSCGY